MGSEQSGWTFDLEAPARRLEAWWGEWSEQQPGRGIPLAPASIGAAGKLLADEAFLRLRGVVEPSSRSEMIGAESEIAAATELYERCGWLDEPMSFHRTPESAAPSFENSWLPGGNYEHMRFESEYEPVPEDPARVRWLGYRENRQAHAWLVRSARHSQRWLLCVPGLGMGRALSDLSVFDAQRLANERECNVAIYVPPLHGPRSRGRRSGEGLFDPSPLNFVHFAAQAVWDLRRMLGWMRDEGADEIGLFGLSMGATPASVLSCIDPGLAAVIAGMPSVDPAHHIAAYSRYVEADSGETASRVRARIQRLYSVVSPYSAQCLVPHSRRFLFGGLVDRVIPPERVRRLAAHWGHPEVAWYPGSHISFSREPIVSELLERAYRDAGIVNEVPRKRPAFDWMPRSSA